VTKQFTAAAILKLVEDKKLSLDNFTKYLDFDTKGRKITIAQLLTTPLVLHKRRVRNLCK
jgi:CubicO group peptidase (beta-lactamase class C family)